jgi:hypothetical protein
MLRKIKQNKIDQSESESESESLSLSESSDEDYIPPEAIELIKINKNLEELNKKFKEKCFWENILWYIKNLIIIITHIIISIYTSIYLINIINPKYINFNTYIIINIFIINISFIQIFSKKYYKNLII